MQAGLNIQSIALDKRKICDSSGFDFIIIIKKKQQKKTTEVFIFRKKS